MKLQFDPKQQYQLDAVNSVVRLLKGLGRSSTTSTSITSAGGDPLAMLGGIANKISLTNAQILANLHAVQDANGITWSAGLESLDFSVEMETGTGKTYVYLRTVLELNRHYGLTKFIVVVPNVAIKEGVKKTIQITSDHFAALYGRPLFEARTFTSTRLSDIRQFSGSTVPQVLLINIDAFNKASNLINRPSEALGNSRPIDLLAGARPIVILDEPQNFEGENARRAIATLAPALTLRYSATHRNPHHLIYRLTPVEAYDLRLVKRIEVLSVLPDRDPGQAFVGLRDMKVGRNSIRYKLEIETRSDGEPKRRAIALTGTGHDLYELSGGLPAYAGLRVSALDAEGSAIELSDGSTVAVHDNAHNRDDVMKAQVRETIREHLEKELAVRRAFAARKRPKILSLFFIDKVANYVPPKSKIRRWFETEFESFRSHPRYKELALPPASEVHGGYFAKVHDNIRDTAGDSGADEEAYELIMKDKEKLLSVDEPLRFIFSHSALREGWDNPNVFQLCTLNETKSELKKRQEIGRGLRLPVDQEGQRITLPAVNFLTVVANESYETFARKLQSEIEEETGTMFPGGIPNRRKRRTIDLRKGWRTNDTFRQLWKSIAKRTKLEASIDIPALVSRASSLLAGSPAIHAPQLVSRRAEVEVSEHGVKARLLTQRSEALVRAESYLPNPLDALQRASGLSRQTIADILKGSGRLGDLLKDSDQFLRQAADAIESALVEGLVGGCRYSELLNETLDLEQFATAATEAYEDRTVSVTKSILSHVEVDSATERKFVVQLDARADIDLFLKLPRWFLVPTPAGDYVPDWGIVKTRNGSATFHLVRETKSSWNPQQLRGSEKAKLECARKHFACISADFAVVTEAAQV